MTGHAGRRDEDRIGRRLLVAGIVAAFLALAAGALALIRPWDHRALKAELDIRAEESAGLARSWPLPPGATGGPVTVTTVLYRFTRSEAVRDVEAPGAFEDTAAFYRNLLGPDGWTETSDGTAGLKRTYCRAPFLADIEERGRVAGTAPRHRYALILRWAPGVTPELCRARS